jgi:hypothetical protein
VTAADRGEVCEAAGADTLKQRTAHPNPTANTHTQAADVQATVQSTNPWPRTHTHLEDERLAINPTGHTGHTGQCPRCPRCPLNTRTGRTDKTLRFVRRPDVQCPFHPFVEPMRLTIAGTNRRRCRLDGHDADSRFPRGNGPPPETHP